MSNQSKQKRKLIVQRTVGYSIGTDHARTGSDRSMLTLVKIGEHGEPDELKASLTWEEAKLIACAVAELEATL